MNHLWKEILLSDPVFKNYKFWINGGVTVKVTRNISNINKLMNCFNIVRG